MKKKIISNLKHIQFNTLKQSQAGFFDIVGLLIGAVVFVFFAFMVIYLFAGGLPTIRHIFNLIRKTFP